MIPYTPIPEEIRSATLRDVFALHNTALNIRQHFQFDKSFQKVGAWINLGCPRAKWNEMKKDLQHIAGRLRSFGNLSEKERAAMQRLFEESIKPEPDFRRIRICWSYVDI